MLIEHLLAQNTTHDCSHRGQLGKEKTWDENRLVFAWSYRPVQKTHQASHLVSWWWAPPAWPVLSLSAVAVSWGPRPWRYDKVGHGIKKTKRPSRSPWVVPHFSSEGKEDMEQEEAGIHPTNPLRVQLAAPVHLKCWQKSRFDFGKRTRIAKLGNFLE